MAPPTGRQLNRDGNER
jgi:NAD(P)-dependent dehydrogenase (short-subunit alcohol dehydrogenase family)